MRYVEGFAFEQVIEASEVAGWIEVHLGIPKYDAYDRLLDSDYIEGSLGSRYVLLEEGEECESEKGRWIQEFIKFTGIESLRLLYG